MKNFVVIDGLDGVGKDTLIRGITTHLENNNKQVFDITDTWKATGSHPDIAPENKLLEAYDVFVAAEPTYVNVGRFIREEILPLNGREYSAEETAHAYALDRHEHLQRNIEPLLNAGKSVFQSRHYVTSIVYQQVQGGGELTVENILNLPGNKLAQEIAPNAMLIPTIQDFDELERRLTNADRGGQDQFENLEFQKKLKPHYESNWLKEHLESVGTKPIYFDVGVPKEQAIKNAIEAYTQATNLQ